MNLNKNLCATVETEVKHAISDLRGVYSGLDWNDDVYASFEAFLDDIDAVGAAFSSLSSQAAGIADRLAGVNIDELRERFCSLCGDD